MGLVYLPTFTIKRNAKCREIHHTWSVWENNVSFGESYKKTTGVYVKYIYDMIYCYKKLS